MSDHDNNDPVAIQADSYIQEDIPKSTVAKVSNSEPDLIKKTTLKSILGESDRVVKFGKTFTDSIYSNRRNNCDKKFVTMRCTW